MARTAKKSAKTEAKTGAKAETKTNAQTAPMLAMRGAAQDAQGDWYEITDRKPEPPPHRVLDVVRQFADEVIQELHEGKLLWTTLEVTFRRTLPMDRRQGDDADGAA